MAKCSTINLLEEIKKSHILMHPALEESFGVVLIEAMSFGVPVVGINSGAVPWVVDVDDRLLVDVTKSDKVAQKRLDLLTGADCYRKISAQTYTNVLNRFSSKPVFDAYLIYYDEIIRSWK